MARADDDQPPAPRHGGLASGCVVFNAFDPTDGGDVLFIADDDALTPVLRQGDPVLDGFGGQFVVSSHAINLRGQIAFYTWLDIDRRAIVRADPVPAGGGDGGDGGDGDPVGPVDPADPTDPTDPGDPNATDGEGGGCALGATPPPAPLAAAAALLALVRAALALRRRRARAPGKPPAANPPRAAPTA